MQGENVLVPVQVAHAIVPVQGEHILVPVQGEHGIDLAWDLGRACSMSSTLYEDESTSSVYPQWQGTDG